LASKLEFRRVFSAYREAMNSTNPFYQVICFDRVIEGVNKIRAARRKREVSAGRTPSDPSERIPDASDPIYGAPSLPSLEYDPASFHKFFGQKFTRVLKETERVIRNAIAHLDPLGDSLVADSYRDLNECEVLIPVVRYMARTMLDNEIALDPDLQPPAQNGGSQGP
jgi:Methylamine utilization protein MauJ